MLINFVTITIMFAITSSFLLLLLCLLKATVTAVVNSQLYYVVTYYVHVGPFISVLGGFIALAHQLLVIAFSGGINTGHKKQ